MDPDEYKFPHESLDAYRVSLQLMTACRRICEALPRGNSHIADHLRRSSAAVPLLVGEGRNRLSPRQRRQRYGDALGEVGEVAVALDILGRMDLADTKAARGLAARVHAMLTGLTKEG